MDFTPIIIFGLPIASLLVGVVWTMWSECERYKQQMIRWIDRHQELLRDYRDLEYKYYKEAAGGKAALYKAAGETGYTREALMNRHCRPIDAEN